MGFTYNGVMAFGSYLATARGERSQQELADALGVTQSTISSWESDETIPRKHRLRAVASAYDVAFDALVSRWMRATPKSRAA